MGRSWLYKVFAVIVSLVAATISASAKYFIKAGGRFGYHNVPISVSLGAIAFGLFLLMMLSFERRR